MNTPLFHEQCAVGRNIVENRHKKIKTDGYQVDMNIVNSEVQVKVLIAIPSICIEGSGYSLPSVTPRSHD